MDREIFSGDLKRRGSAIQLSEWEAVIEAHPALAPQEPYDLFNPFTGETYRISGEGKAKYIAEPENNGQMVAIRRGN